MSRGRRLGNRNWVTDLGTVLYQLDFAEVPVVLSGRFAARRRARDIIPRTPGGEAIILVTYSSVENARSALRDAP